MKTIYLIKLYICSFLAFIFGCFIYPLVVLFEISDEDKYYTNKLKRICFNPIKIQFIEKKESVINSNKFDYSFACNFHDKQQIVTISADTDDEAIDLVYTNLSF